MKIEDLLGQVYMSRRAFEQRFRRVVGNPPMRILRMRIDRAKDLLRNSSTVFRKRVGLSPKEDRRQHRFSAEEP